MFSPLLPTTTNNDEYLSVGDKHEVGWLDEYGNENPTLTSKGSNSPSYYLVGTELEEDCIFGMSRVCKISLPYEGEYEMKLDKSTQEKGDY